MNNFETRKSSKQTGQNSVARLFREREDLLRTIGDVLSRDVAELAEVIINSMKNGGKVLIAGNGGSAADSQHFAAEMVGRFKRERQALPAIALTTDSSILTAIANDYSFADVFSRQIAALGKPGDVFIGITTSGKSENIITAAKQAVRQNMKAYGLTGKHGGPLKKVISCIEVPHTATDRIQEGHIAILHIVSELVESALSNYSITKGD